jgi:acetate kinase
MAMESKILVINSGSASKKYALYSEGKKVYSAHFEFVNDEPVVTTIVNNRKNFSTIDDGDYENSLKYCIDEFLQIGIISELEEIQNIGVRIVAPGGFFTRNHYLDENYLKKFKEALDSDPIHIEPVQQELNKIKDILKSPIVFHQ